MSGNICVNCEEPIYKSLFGWRHSKHLMKQSRCKAVPRWPTKNDELQSGSSALLNEVQRMKFN